MIARRLALATTVLAACIGTAPSALAQAVPADPTVRFRDRRIDLDALLEGYPYVRLHADFRANQLTYFREGREGRALLTLPLDGAALDLDRGTPLGDIDWSRRTLRTLRSRPGTNEYIVLADDANDERFNLFALARDTGALRRITDKPYVYGWGLDATGRYLGYVARYGTRQPYHSCLNVYDFVGGTDREVVCDTPETSFTWSDVSFSPDASAVVITALRATDRNHGNLVAIDLREPAPSLRLLTNPEHRRRNIEMVHDWFDASHVVYTSDEDGFTNVYIVDVADRTNRAITHFREDVVGVVPFVATGSTLYGAMVRRPYESELFVLDPADGNVLARRVFDASADFLDYAGDRAMLESASRRTRLEVDALTIERTDTSHAVIRVEPRVTLSASVDERIVRCDVERVQIPTFDVDPHTGRTRMLHAYLQTPRVPPRDPSRRFALVEAFYGGENRFDGNAQVLCAAGAIVLSPSVRGSAGFGAEFAALNDHDLGGDEVVDLIECARYLAQRFSLPPRRIGLFGASHGGYEVMRAMTFPRGVNGRDTHFDWGFGISWFGFSNIVSFYERSNIPDWVQLEAGDPVRDRERLIERSPSEHADLATGPMLLLHGENDRRVPVTESRQMADALRRAHREFRYVEFAGQGHGLKGLANQYRVWNEVFGFLEPVLDRQPAHAPVSRPSRTRALLLVIVAALVAAGVLGYGVRASR